MSAETWTEIIRPNTNRFSIDLKKIWKKRDLIFLFVKRDLITMYKQTLLGPLWHILQPVLTAMVFTIIFGRLANLSTDGLPPFLFYFSGIFIWNFFAEVLMKTSVTFISNADLFGKVFFPRMVVPVAITITGLVKLGVNFVIFIAVLFYYGISGTPIGINWQMFWLIFVLIGITSLLSLSLGMIISALTTRYRDFKFLLQFGIQMGMYLSPIVYPLSVAKGFIYTIVYYNPMSHVIEGMRYVFLGSGTIDKTGLIYSFCLSIVLFLFGNILFNRVERSFIDTV